MGCMSSVSRKVHNRYATHKNKKVKKGESNLPPFIQEVYEGMVRHLHSGWDIHPPTYPYMDSTSGYPWPSGTVKSICRHIYRIRSWRSPKKKQSRILWNFYFPVSPSANFHQAKIFFSFLSFFFSPRIFFCFSFFFFFFFPRTDSSQKS